MTYTRYVSISSLNCSKERFEYEIPKTNPGKYIVDDSHFCPTSEAIKNLQNARPLTEEEIKTMYDFPNGKDTGQRIPVDRMHGISDITEISTEIKNQSEDVKANINSVKMDYERMKLKAEKNKTSTATVTTSTSSASSTS